MFLFGKGVTSVQTLRIVQVAGIEEALNTPFLAASAVVVPAVSQKVHNTAPIG